ncbi:MAG: signal peptidase I [Clostridia bacterium]|nr:signal peptidase I [Clostridia bacterium]
MNRDKKVILGLSIIIFAALALAFFVELGSSKIVAACLLLPLTVITVLFVRKRSSLSIQKKEVLLLSAIIGAMYALAIQLTGIFFGFHKNPYFVNVKILLTTVLPLVVIIVATELIRAVFLAQKNTFASVITYLSCVLAEILAFSNLAGITGFNQFMDLVGLTLFPALSANIYYHFVSRRFGALPNIVYRIITTLYIYFVPNVTAMSDALLACIKIFLPLILLALMSALFEKKKKLALQKRKKLSAISIALAMIVGASFAALVSCQFRFGALVIATESMTGEINKGDLVIYERYDDQTIQEGQVIVFLRDGNKIVHRVVDIEHIGGEIRYYTKGDANNSIDIGYVTDGEIVGTTSTKIAYVGFPTLWLRELLEGSK